MKLEMTWQVLVASREPTPFGWTPKPGDVVVDVSDKVGTYGLIVATGSSKVTNHPIAERCLVLWSREISLGSIQ